MKLRLYTLIGGMLVITFASSQTGPAGVGSTTNNMLWLKADEGTSTTTGGAAVSSWADQSGNGNNVSQSAANKQPLYTTSLMNGFPALQFDNVTSTNDKLTAPDAASLDNVSGYTFFTVSRPQVLDGEARVIISKRNGVDTEESFMLFYYSSDKFYTDIQTTNNRYNTPYTFSANTNYMIDVVYDGSLASASRSKTYVAGSLNKTATEASATIPDNNSPLIIGSTDNGDGRPFGGYICEVIGYRTALNKASRIIVNNYLSAKYNIALTVNDKYAGDNAANGDYDREVAGVGSDTTQPGSVVGSNTSFSSSVSGGLTVEVNSGLDVGDYILAGHASYTNSTITTDVSGMTGTLNGRWERVWYVDVTNTSTVINTNIEFDMSDGDVGSVTLGSTSDYKLLYRSGLSGTWTELATANATPGDRVKFNNINISNDGYYTIGTHNHPASPLPIELLDFNALLNSGKTDLTWTTASETNNAFFAVEKTKDGVNFETVVTMQGAGNSTSTLSYADTDFNPYKGISYYRLKQTDFNGNHSYSALVTVNYTDKEGAMSLYPNPVSSENGFNVNLSGLQNQEVLVVVRDITGREFYSKVTLVTEDKQLIAIDTERQLAAGTYIVVASSNNKIYSQKLIVK